MSSIYKKGRDNYYYYQAYITNPKTKKKDKRVFRALGTKDRTVAVEMKKKYDREFADSETISFQSLFQNISNMKIKLFFSTLLLTTAVTFFNKRNQNIEEVNKAKVGLLKKDTSTLVDVSDAIKESFEKNRQGIELDTKIKSQLTNQANIIQPDKNIIEYYIDRIQKFPSISQVKLNVLISNNHGQDSVKELCEILRKKHNEFTNIIICFYADNQDGIALSSGETQTRGHLESWIAMYTYNPVEGSLFNPSPTEYRRGS